MSTFDVAIFRSEIVDTSPSYNSYYALNKTNIPVMLKTRTFVSSSSAFLR